MRSKVSSSKSLNNREKQDFGKGKIDFATLCDGEGRGGVIILEKKRLGRRG